MDQPIKANQIISTLLLCCILMLANTSAFAITSASSSNLKTSSAASDYQQARRYETGTRVKRDINKAIKWYKKAANKSHAKAQYQLGILYYEQKSYKKAKYWLEKRAIAGEPDAQYHYANILRFGLGTKQKTSEARKWYQKAAKQDHKQAQYELALMFQKGIGAKKNQTTAIKWLKKAANQNHKQAKQALKALPARNEERKRAQKTKQKKTAQQLFLEKNLKLARAGKVEAQYKLGNAYTTGKNAPLDLKKAYLWLTKAAKADHADAQYQLASMYFKGNDVIKKNLDKAREWYSKAADNEHQKANKKLDTIANESNKKQQVKQFGNITDSALLGDSEQQYELGMRYLLGFKTATDEQQAYYWLNLAANQNHPRALYQLGNQYMTGNVVERDNKKAIFYFAAAARQNIKAAKTALSLFTDSGYKNRVQAENGDKAAQLALALTYLQKNTTSDNQQGLEWLHKSANQSFSPALITLAKIYETGDIIPRSYEKAFLAYLSAADQNDASAQYQLGRMYQSGIGTKLNQKLAYHWIEKAASQGMKEAQQALQFSGL
ncbi:MAG: SEL1-like repeat protein [Gammaproteobacteria bacterium]|nr:SEL1-like repeat protein [Gammaproteobacteria bacterium]